MVLSTVPEQVQETYYDSLTTLILVYFNNHIHIAFDHAHNTFSFSLISNKMAMDLLLTPMQ